MIKRKELFDLLTWLFEKDYLGDSDPSWAIEEIASEYLYEQEQKARQARKGEN